MLLSNSRGLPQDYFHFMTDSSFRGSPATEMIMSHSIVMAGIILGIALTVGACGTSKTDRGLSGAGIGAAAGGLGGLLVGSPATGALLGAAAGGATGVLTDSDQVDLGKPIWK